MSDKEKNKDNLQNSDLWKMVTKTTKPLHPNRKPPAVKDYISKKEAEKIKKEPPATYIAKRNITEEYSHKPLGIDRRTDDKLRRGKMQLEGKLDLHGHTRDEARHALIQFIQRGYDQGKRAVLVITGKGYHSKESGGILRQSVPEWLKEPPLSQIILKYHTAQPKDGGDGALYILIRRKR